jgi:hypothetical protein
MNFWHLELRNDLPANSSYLPLVNISSRPALNRELYLVSDEPHRQPSDRGSYHFIHIMTEYGSNIASSFNR